jgi:UDP-2-acetamido-3-amino-2,3-dideoxy-glucuronate N-acetyltransferase
MWGKNLVRNFEKLGVLRTVCDTDLEQREWVAKTYPHIEATVDWQEIVCNPKIKGVVIATPSPSHYTIAKHTLECGKDVFVEKPMAMKLSEGETLVRLSEDTGRILLVGHLLEYHPCIVRLKQIIDSGDMGNIQYVYSTRLDMGKFRNVENILWSFAPHDIAVVLLLLGDSPISVSAFGGYYLRQDIADVTFTTMRFHNGVTAHIFLSWLYPYREQKLVVVGDKCMAVFVDDRVKSQLTLYPNRVRWIGGNPYPEWGEATCLTIDYTEPLELECRDFIHCIKTRSSPKVDTKRSLEVLKILECSQRSLEDNRK